MVPFEVPGKQAKITVWANSLETQLLTYLSRNMETKWYLLNERTAQKHLNFLKLNLTKSDKSSGKTSQEIAAFHKYN